MQLISPVCKAYSFTQDSGCGLWSVKILPEAINFKQQDTLKFSIRCYTSWAYLTKHGRLREKGECVASFLDVSSCGIRRQDVSLTWIMETEKYILSSPPNSKNQHYSDGQRIQNHNSLKAEPKALWNFLLLLAYCLTLSALKAIDRNKQNEATPKRRLVRSVKKCTSLKVTVSSWRNYGLSVAFRLA